MARARVAASASRFHANNYRALACFDLKVGDRTDKAALAFISCFIIAPVSAVIGDRECFMLPPDREFVRMEHYRVYIIGQDGHFIRSIDLGCKDHGAAIKSAKQLIDGHDLELWQRDRKSRGLIATRSKAG